MKPALQDIRFDPILSNVSVAYKNAKYIAEEIFPVVKVKTKTGYYYKFDKSKFRKVPTLRGPGSPAREVGYGLSKSTAYVSKDHALKEMVADEMKEEAQSPLSPEMDAAENVAERLLIEKEYDLSAYMADTANLTNNITLATTDQWSDYNNSDPIGDIETGIESVRSKIFLPANTLILGQKTYNQLKHHPDIVERIKYSGFGKVTTDILAELFDVSKVIVGATGRNTAVEGIADSIGYIWGKHAWLAYITPRPAKNAVSFGYHFQYKLRRADKWYDKDREGTFVRVHDHYTREIITVDAAYFIKNAVA